MALVHHHNRAAVRVLLDDAVHLWINNVRKRVNDNVRRLDGLADGIVRAEAVLQPNVSHVV